VKGIALALLAVLTIIGLEREPEEVRVSVFAEVLERTLEHEGGWYDGTKPHDPNPTMKGVTQRTYNGYRDRRRLPQRSVREIETHELEAIYRTYWDAVKADKLGPLTAGQVFDHAVNAGPHRAIQVLQRAVGVNPDGVIGPRTMEAVRGVPDTVAALLVGYERLQHYCDLARSPKHRPSLLAWTQRTVTEAEAARKACLDTDYVRV